jgi:cysteinyl-tRNA synthetase
MIRLSNSLSRSIEDFAPQDPTHVKMYVCGPTVYARPHIGNARSVVVYDMLYRLLAHDFPKITYVRNITDVDDKINAAAIERKITIQQLTAEVEAQFADDMGALNCLRPTIEPKATEHIAQMIAMIQSLIDNGNAYVAESHVLFAVQTDTNYGCLSRRSVDDMVAGARVEVAPYKKYAGDFVLWKPASEKDDPSSKFESPWGIGRPGWHIECSAMSNQHLGADFDIHGGGADLMFPHHENELAQSTCANKGSRFAKYWVHNGFLTVNGEKMSKSLGNFITVHDLLEKGVKGEAIRFALMLTRYNEPFDWTEKLLSDAQKVVDKMYRQDAPDGGKVNDEVLAALRDNLNTPKALAVLQTLEGAELKATAKLLGFLRYSSQEWFQGAGEDVLWIEIKIEERNAAKKARDFKTSDAIRDMLKEKGILLEDSATGTTWRRA